MNTYSKMLPVIDSNDYEIHFWNALRGKKGHKEHLEKGVESNTGAYTLTTKGQSKFTTAIHNESVFRNIATHVQVFDHDYRIKTVGVNDVSAWVAEGGAIPISDGMEDFGEVTLSTHKIAVFLKLEETLVRDPFFKIEDYLVKRLAKNFGKAEDYGFIRGTGVNMPTGILADNGGAEVGVTTKALTYDDVVKLFFSVKPEYRKNGVWLMNDETALTLRTLKDADGNYIWNHANDTILGHKGLQFRVDHMLRLGFHSLKGIQRDIAVFQRQFENGLAVFPAIVGSLLDFAGPCVDGDRKSTRLNSSHR